VNDLIPPTDPRLRQPSEEFDFAAPQMDPRELATLLETTMQEKQAFGLSAVQLGLPYRVFAMRTNPDLTVFNPRLIDQSEQLVGLDEGCLSYPNLILKIKRPRLIRVRFTMKNMETTTMKFDGMTARIFLHELDHLDGIRHIDRVGRLKLLLAMKKAAKHGTHYKIGDLV
jgi:peptide deformylase